MSSKYSFAVPWLVIAVGISLAIAQDTPPPPPPAPSPAPSPAPTPSEGTPAPPEAPATPPTTPPAPPAALAAAKEAFKKGSWQEALDAALKALQEQPKDLESLYIAGASERQTGKLSDAEGHLRTLVETSPNFPLSHFQLGYVLFLKAENLSRGGQAEPAKAKYVDAAAEFGKELERNTTHAPSLSSRAIALTRAGRVDESVQAHEAWITGVPQKNDPVVSLAATYAGAGRATDAMNALERLPDKTPKAVFDATIAAASVFSAKKDFGAAVPFLEKAVATDPASTKALGLLTEACALSGLANDAARNLQKLLTMDPAADEAEAAGEAIKTGLGPSVRPPAGVEPPAIVRVPSPKYPRGQENSVETEVFVLTLVQKDGTVGGAVLVPNRIWKDIRASGFEAGALDAARRGKYTPGKKDGNPADMWIVVSLKFSR